MNINDIWYPAVVSILFTVLAIPVILYYVFDISILSLSRGL